MVTAGSAGAGPAPIDVTLAAVAAEPFVGSWHIWQVPRLSTLSRRLSPTVVEPSGYGTLAE